MKRYFIADDDTPGTYAELDMEKFSDVREQPEMSALLLRPGVSESTAAR